MYNQQFLAIAQQEIEAQIHAMPITFTSFEFYSSFESNHPQKYQDLLRVYTDRQHDEAHARQIVNSQLMHTVNDRFHHLARKVETIENPKGGDMSLWSKGWCASFSRAPFN